MGVISNSEKLCDRIIETAAEFKGGIHQHRALAFFMAAWCTPCNRIIGEYTKTPIVREFLTQHGISALYVDVDKDELHGVLEAEGIREIPIIKAYSKGKKINEQIGHVLNDSFMDLVKEWYVL